MHGVFTSRIYFLLGGPADGICWPGTRRLCNCFCWHNARMHRGLNEASREAKFIESDRVPLTEVRAIKSRPMFRLNFDTSCTS